MKKIFRYLVDYQRKHFDWKVYSIILLFLIICITINYLYDFEDGVIDAYSGKPIKWLWMFLFQGVPYLFICLILYVFNKSRSWLTSMDFWLKFLIGFGLLAVDRSFYGAKFIVQYVETNEAFFVLKCLNWSSRFFLITIPLLLLYPILENDQPRFWYGMKWEKFDARPYLFMLGIMAIVLGMASFLADMQSVYPKYNRAGADYFLATNNTPEWVLAAIFEMCYGSVFVSVELFFRGFLIFAFARTLGSWAILPMVATYAFLHFGKPLSETIGSVFGGYILGILAYNSRNIWGGIFIHLGVAWLMELFGWMQGRL